MYNEESLVLTCNHFFLRNQEVEHTLSKLRSNRLPRSELRRHLSEALQELLALKLEVDALRLQLPPPHESGAATYLYQLQAFVGNNLRDFPWNAYTQAQRF